MKTYRFTIAADVRAYGTVQIEAEDLDAAWQRAKDIAAAMNGESHEEPPEMADVQMKPEYEFTESYEALDDIEEVA